MATFHILCRWGHKHGHLCRSMSSNAKGVSTWTWGSNLSVSISRNHSWIQHCCIILTYLYPPLFGEEKVIGLQLQRKVDYLDPFQSNSRPGYSIETAIIRTEWTLISSLMRSFCTCTVGWEWKRGYCDSSLSSSRFGSSWRWWRNLAQGHSLLIVSRLDSLLTPIEHLHKYAVWG